MKAVSAEGKVELVALGGAVPAAVKERATLRRLGRLRWGLGAASVLLLIVASAVFAPWIAPHDPLAVNIRHRLAPPAWMEGGAPNHLLGTDQVGRDLLSRMIFGGRVSLVVGVTAVLLSASIGVLLGLGAGYFGGSTDWTIMTGVNVMLTFPFVLLALAVIAVLGPNLVNMIIVLGVAGWPIYARVVRAETMAIREREFVLAGRALGMSHLRIIFRYMIPNCLALYIVLVSVFLGTAIVAEATLSFLGIGVPPDVPSWGGMLNGAAQTYVHLAPWLGVFPGLAIAIVVFAWNLLGDALRDVLDPRLRGTW